VLTLDPMTLDDVLHSIVQVGRATGNEENATAAVAGLRERLARVAAGVTGRPRPRIAALEWTDPPYSSGHWVPDMVEAAGAVPALGASGTRSARITWDDVTAAAPDLVVVAPCGYGIDDARQLARDLVDAQVLPPSAPVWAVDANNVFVRPGPRIVDGVETLAHIAHPDVAPPVDGLAVRVYPD
jgi:iron complex transport system substrate-binding protein